MANKPNTFEDLCKVLSNLTPIQVAVVARQQGIEVPTEVEASALAAELIQDWKEGSDRDPDRVYLRTKGIPITTGDKPATARGLYLEVRALRAARAVLDAAIQIAEDRGFNTSPAESARKSGPVAKSSNNG